MPLKKSGQFQREICIVSHYCMAKCKNLFAAALAEYYRQVGC